MQTLTLRAFVIVALASACSSPETAPSAASVPPAPAAREAPPVAPAIGPTEVEREMIEDVVHGHLADIEACVAAQRVAASDLAGVVEVRWVVAAAGTVSDPAVVSSTLGTATARDGGEPARAVERCILAAVDGWTYPAVVGGHAVTVHHSFVLTGAAPSAAPAGGAASIGAHGVPRVQTEPAAVSGGLSPEVVRHVVRRHINEVRFCYEQSLCSAPELHGRVTVHFTVDAAGAVGGPPALASGDLSAGAVADGGEPARTAETCLLRAVARWTFPAPDGGGTVTVDYPLCSRPTHRGATRFLACRGAGASTRWVSLAWPPDPRRAARPRRPFPSRRVTRASRAWPRSTTMDLRA